MSNQFVDLSTNAMVAWGQVRCLLGAFVCLALGSALLGEWIYWRLHAEKVSGRIIGVRQKGQFYLPVYRYTLSTGQSFEATSNAGSGSLYGISADKIVPLMVFADHPDEARSANNVVFTVIGSLLIIAGLFFLYTACTAYPVNKMTFIILAALAVYGLIHFQRILFPQTKRTPFAQWYEVTAAKARAERDALPMQSIAQVSASPIIQKQMAQQARYAPQIRLIFSLFGPLMIIGSLFFGWQTMQLMQHGLRTAGVVTSLDGQWSSGRSNGSQTYVYYPIVDFKTQEGQDIHFKGKSGSNPPMYRAGDDVKVLYDVANPEKAIIDHGAGNFIGPGLLLLFGVVIFAIGRRMTGKT